MLTLLKDQVVEAIRASQRPTPLLSPLPADASTQKEEKEEEEEISDLADAWKMLEQGSFGSVFTRNEVLACMALRNWYHSEVMP